MHELNCTLQIHLSDLGSNVVYANLFNAKFYTVEKFTKGYVAAHGAVGSITCACAALCIWVHLHILADHVTLSIS